MNKTFLRATLILFLFLSLSCNVPAGNENTIVLMKTTHGDIRLRLYDETPLHRDNFIKLINSGFYEGIAFHRIINNFMIQAGDPATRSTPISQSADSLNSFTIQSEFKPDLYHKRGALAAAREGNDVNPEMRSSGTHFYIVQGVKYTDEELDLAERRINSNIKQGLFSMILKQIADSSVKSGIPLSDAEIQEKASVRMFEYLTSHPDYKIPENQREVYRTSGGVPRLDGTYTVFGEVLEGLDVVDRIAGVATDETDKPVTEVRILKIKIEGK
jgi:cyclophilin family peptidyl-prolyl cis-trans isomerase